MSNRLPWIAAAGVALLLLVSVWEPLQRAHGSDNLYAHQAQAWLDGRLNILEKRNDVSVFRGKFYVGFPPFPSAVLLPFVAASGLQATNPLLIALGLSAACAWLLVRMLQLLPVNSRLAPWIVAAFFFGSPFWSAVRFSDGVWYFAHVVSVMCLLLAIFVALRTGWGWLAGLCVGLSFLSRQLTIFAGVFVLWLVWRHHAQAGRQRRWLHVAAFAVALAACGAVYLIYNGLRFGNPLDTGYEYIELFNVLKYRYVRYGLFNIAYVPFNVYYLFLQGFHLRFDPLYQLTPVGVDPFGTALTLASPFIFATIYPRLKDRTVLAAWLSIALICVPQLFYYNNGSSQWNAQRFTLDFWPILLVLIGLGAARAPQKLWRATVVVAICLNAITWWLMRSA